MIESLLLDLRYAARSLRRTPGFTALAVITLGFGIGAATVGYGLLQQVLLEPLPGVRDPSRLGLVWFATRTADGAYRLANVHATQRKMLLRGVPAVSALSGAEMSNAAVALPGRAPRTAFVDFVTPDYFATLGTTASRGRLLMPDDDGLPDGQRVVVIGDRFWHRELGGRDDVIGQSVRVNGLPFTIVGVAEPGFTGTDRFQNVEMWLPGNTAFDVRHFPRTEATRWYYLPGYSYFEHVMRLRKGATFEQASAQLQSALRSVAPTDSLSLPSSVAANVFPGVGLRALGRDRIDRQVWLVLGVAGLVLLAACANVANLLLFRRIQRRSDSLVRLALGGSRGRLARLFLVESAVLGVAGAVVGVGVAIALRSVFGSLRLVQFVNVGPIQLDGPVLVVALAVGVLASLFGGALPAVLGSDLDLTAQLKESGPTQVGGASWIRTGLATFQVAVSLVLVAGAYLFADTLRAYSRIPLGFEPAGLSVYTVEQSVVGYQSTTASAYMGSLVEQVGAKPGIQGVALASIAPFAGGTGSERVGVPGGGEGIDLQSAEVSPGYFGTLGIPIVRGEDFSGHDTETVILSQAAAKALYGKLDPIGRTLVIHERADLIPRRVIGIVGDAVYSGFLHDRPQMMYESLGMPPRYFPMVIVKARIPEREVTREVTDVARVLDPDLPVNPRGPMTGAVAASFASQTLFFKLVGALSALTLVLTTVGVYSLIAYGVTARAREFGIRLALGAATTNLVHVAVGPSLFISGVGTLSGVLGALYLTRFIASYLYGVSPLDPLAFITAALILAGAVLLASWLPARRAAKIDPMVALRYE